RAEARNLAEVVDPVRLLKFPAASNRDEIVEISHRTDDVVEEGVTRCVAGGGCHADGLAERVDAVRKAERAPQRSQVARGGNHAVGGGAKGMLEQVARERGCSDNLTRGTDAVAAAERATQRAQVAGGRDGAVGGRPERVARSVGVGC